MELILYLYTHCSLINWLVPRGIRNFLDGKMRKINTIFLNVSLIRVFQDVHALSKVVDERVILFKKRLSKQISYSIFVETWRNRNFSEMSGT